MYLKEWRAVFKAEYVPPSGYTPLLRRFTDEAARDLRETVALYTKVRAAHYSSIWAQDDVADRINRHCAEIVTKLVELPAYTPFAEALDRCQVALIKEENAI